MRTEKVDTSTNVVSVLEEVPITERNDFNPFSQTSSKLIAGLRKECIEFRIRLNLAKLVVRNYRNPMRWLKIIRTLDRRRRMFLGESRIKKIAKAGGKYYWDLYIPGWPSVTFDDFFEAEISRIAPVSIKTNRFANIFIAITKKCPLRCEHCFEWDALNGKEKLTLSDLKTIVQRFQERGTAQFQITGGEPMLRVNDILEILKCSRQETQFWILTSGFNFTFENAKKLKDAGLTGVVVSLDHFEPEAHNLFRGFKNSFSWVERAVGN